MNSFSSASALLLTVILSSAGSVMAADNNRVVYETEIEADIDAVWNAFTTNDGLRTWMAPLVEIELAVGGKMKANYNAMGKIGDERAIAALSRILAAKGGGLFKKTIAAPETVRVRAAWALSQIPTLEAQKTLSKFSKDPNRQIRSLADPLSDDFTND